MFHFKPVLNTTDHLQPHGLVCNICGMVPLNSSNYNVQRCAKCDNHYETLFRKKENYLLWMFFKPYESRSIEEAIEYVFQVLYASFRYCTPYSFNIRYKKLNYLIGTDLRRFVTSKIPYANARNYYDAWKFEIINYNYPDGTPIDPRNYDDLKKLFNFTNLKVVALRNALLQDIYVPPSVKPVNNVQQIDTNDLRTTLPKPQYDQTNNNPYESDINFEPNDTSSDAYPRMTSFIPLIQSMYEDNNQTIAELDDTPQQIDVDSMPDIDESLDNKGSQDNDIIDSILNDELFYSPDEYHNDDDLMDIIFNNDF